MFSGFILGPDIASDAKCCPVLWKRATPVNSACPSVTDDRDAKFGIRRNDYSSVGQPG